jgi:hypothetical protein
MYWEEISPDSVISASIILSSRPDGCFNFSIRLLFSGRLGSTFFGEFDLFELLLPFALLLSMLLTRKSSDYWAIGASHGFICDLPWLIPCVIWLLLPLAMQRLLRAL